mmetsp:Transcript_139856/g.389740  ORF Transcript_139856/g.389740 Transcript_139856/m.389740 type:complete len:414 (-) Transcript_139856:279-1520(-)
MCSLGHGAARRVLGLEDASASVPPGPGGTGPCWRGGRPRVGAAHCPSNDHRSNRRGRGGPGIWLEDKTQQRSERLRYHRRHQVPCAHDRGEAQVLCGPDVSHDIHWSGPRHVLRSNEVCRAAPGHVQQGFQISDVVAHRAIADTVVQDHLLAQLEQRGYHRRRGASEICTERLSHWARLVGTVPCDVAPDMQGGLHVWAIQVPAEGVGQRVEAVGIRHSEVIVEELPSCSLRPGVEPPDSHILAEIPGLLQTLLDGRKALLLLELLLFQLVLVDDPCAESHHAHGGVLDKLVVEAIPDDDALEGDLLRSGAQLVGDVRHVLPGVGLPRDPKRVLGILGVKPVEAAQGINKLRAHLLLAPDVRPSLRVGEASPHGVVHCQEVVLLRDAVRVVDKVSIRRDLLRSQVLLKESDQR